MAGGGYYPIMTDIEWANAPWNQPDAVYENCPDCNGTGGDYYNEDGDVISRADYERLSEEDKELWTHDKCERCDGCGTIEVEPYVEIGMITIRKEVLSWGTTKILWHLSRA